MTGSGGWSDPKLGRGPTSWHPSHMRIAISLFAALVGKAKEGLSYLKDTTPNAFESAVA